MKDKKIISLISLILVLTAFLGPWPIAMNGNREFALAFACSAALLSLGLALLSRSEYFSRIVLWGFALTIGLGVTGIGVSIPIWMLRMSSARAIEAEAAAQQAQTRLEQIKGNNEKSLKSAGKEDLSQNAILDPVQMGESIQGTKGTLSTGDGVISVDEDTGVVTINGWNEGGKRTKTIIDAN